MLKSLLFAASLLIVPGLAAAEPDAEIGKPYRLQIVLRVASHRLLTPVFKDQLKRELREGMQAALGAMGRVEVVDSHPLLDEIEAKGLRQVLDERREVTDTKTHFVLVDFVDGQYEIQARQHDGYTGLASPVVRQVRTADRQFVGRTTALLLDRDFGLVGMLDPEHVVGPKVAITLKGKGLDSPLERWVKKDEIFAIAQVAGDGERRQGSEVPFALLQVIDGPRDGVCQCRVLHRYKDPLVTGGKYRCLKLGTTEGPLRLRFVNDKGLPENVTVRISPYGFGDQDAVKEEGATRDGFFEMRKYHYPHVAFVRCFYAGSVCAQVPVGIFGDELVLVAVRIGPNAVPLGDLDSRRRRWEDQVRLSLRGQALLRDELIQLIQKSRHAEARDHAQASLKLLEKDFDLLTGDWKALRAKAEELAVPDRVQRLDHGEKALQEITSWRQILEKRIADLDDVLRQENDPKRKEIKSLVAQARLEEDKADYGGALALYDKALELAGADSPPQLVQTAAALKKAWTPVSPEHQKARDFVYTTWPAFKSFADIQANLAPVQQAFTTCRAAGDKMTARKLLLTNANLAELLIREQKGLRTQVAEENERIGKIKELLDQMLQLSKEAHEFMNKP